MCIILIDWLNVTIWLKRCKPLEQKYIINGKNQFKLKLKD